MMWPSCSDPTKCQHWQDWKNQKNIDYYDWCHVCTMDHDCFKPAAEWKSCGNCSNADCPWGGDGVACNRWEQIRCRCGGTLSEIREHNGKRYRHCYSCHFEFYEEG